MPIYRVELASALYASALVVADSAEEAENKAGQGEWEVLHEWGPDSEYPTGWYVVDGEATPIGPEEFKKLNTTIMEDEDE